jgi:LysM repeat protein
MIKDVVKDTELVLPVTPSSFEISHGINVETINIHTLGDVVLPGHGTLSTIKIDCMLPASKYSFNQPNAKLTPYDYIKKFKGWCDKHTILRFAVSKTMVNLDVIITDLSYGERDGTKDVYATITFREYRNLSVIQENETRNKTRGSEKSNTEVDLHVVKPGDTLCSICRKYYGNSSLYLKLASYNNIKNANLIIVGQKIKLPAKSLL